MSIGVKQFFRYRGELSQALAYFCAGRFFSILMAVLFAWCGLFGLVTVAFYRWLTVSACFILCLISM